MDPNACLARIREMAADLSNGRSGMDVSKELAEAVADLDQWISRGGFLPSEWKAKDAAQAIQWRPRDAEGRRTDPIETIIDLGDPSTVDALNAADHARPAVLHIKDPKRGDVYVHVKVRRYGVRNGVKVDLTAVNRTTDRLASVNAVPWKLKA